MHIISAQVESELVALEDGERNEYLIDLGVKDPSAVGLNLLVQSVYRMLDLQTFFTTGAKETRAWTIKKGSTAPKAASVIHSDFEKGFIRAECVNWKDLCNSSSWANARESGIIRSEGKDYVVEEGILLYSDTIPDISYRYLHIICRIRQESMWEIKYV